MVQRLQRQERAHHQPGHRQGAGASGTCRHDRSGSGAARRRQGFQALAQGLGVRALQAAAQGRRHHSQSRRRDRATDDAGARQAAARSQDGNAGRRRHHGLVRRRGAPRVRPRRPGPCRGRAADRRQGARRPSRGLHAVELSDQPGRAQDIGCAGSRLLRHPQGAGRNTRQLRRAGAVLRRCRAACRRRQSGVRCAVGSVRVPDPAPDYSQSHLHRFHARGQEAGGIGGSAHEAHHDGTRRSRTGDRVCRRRCRPGHQATRWRQVPQRRPGVRVADPLPGA